MPIAQQSQTTPTWIITSQNSHPKLVSNKKPAKVNADRFGIFYRVDPCGSDPEIGQRTFHIIRYNVKNPGKITTEMEDGNVKVLYVEEGAEKDENKELEGEVEVYEDKRSTIATTISNLNQAVSVFTFGTLDASGPSGDLVPELDGAEGMADPEVAFQNYTCLPNSELSVLSNALHISCEGSPLIFKARVCLFEKFEEIMIKLKERGLVGEIC